MSLASMTGFSRAEGQAPGLTWAWELRSVNGRGLDLRFKLPAGLDALEPRLREDTGRVLKRGNVTANLVLKREDRSRLVIDGAVLDELLRLTDDIALRIPGAAPPRADVLLGLPGVMRAGSAEDGPPVDLETLRAGFLDALRQLHAARQEEGARLQTLLSGQLDEVAALHREASTLAADQPAQQQARMMESVAALLADHALPAERIAQEVAILASRSDIREELDRLHSHIEAARALLAEGVAVGRRFDFLVQEFVREINTLCSKSASIPLTRTGLALKAVVEQMREQVQNVE